MSPSDVKTLLIYILIALIVGEAWFFVAMLNSKLRTLSRKLQNRIDHIYDMNRKW